jgi:hypothetical protein
MKSTTPMQEIQIALSNQQESLLLVWRYAHTSGYLPLERETAQRIQTFIDGRITLKKVV